MSEATPEEMREYWAWVRAGRPRDESGRPVEIPAEPRNACPRCGCDLPGPDFDCPDPCACHTRETGQ